ncbi:MAG: leucine--tRNA ligase [Acidobacteria bacterium]|jgi:leucyl-tRNA synthetase|nr:MAG: leucine--tRNA ligase [Acidobacteriota bacterium]
MIMDEKYFAKKVEQKWQKIWSENKTFEVEIDSEKPKFYALEMLPYPSGNLHMGHVRNYSIGDALAWYKRLKGFNVLHPIGWDSFGQPAEDAAIKRGVNPLDWTEDNINHMRNQLKRLGLSYDWRREIFAHRPDYYKFDQWFFLKMYEKGLAYKKMTQVNWCPNCQATLSNEQASGGLCWRCGNLVTKKDLEQWFLRITNYADQLLEDMSEIEAGWPQKVLKRQRDWIGRSEGAYVDFKLTQPVGEIEKIRIFTTRIDTIFGANAVVVAAEHPLIDAYFECFTEEVKKTIEKIRLEKRKITDYEAEQEKEGIDTGLKAINPFSGEELPIWVGNYVMMEYGTGAVMSVPAHDERDFEFAKKYGLPIRQVISSPHQSFDKFGQEAFTEYGILINSGEWTGKTSEEAIKEMAEYARRNGFGEPAVTYRLRDWGISRQRYWGAPIPIVYCDDCGIVPEKYENLPIELPKNVEITGMGESPLAKVAEFVNCSCPQCGKPAKRETDTMDTFVDSCWYYFRYCDPHNPDLPFDPKIVHYWTPVDQYIGGDDHAVMHLIYTRFWTKVMRDIGLVNFNEPVKRLLTQGMVVGETFFEVIPNPDDPSGKGKRIYYPPDTVQVERDQKGRIISAKSADGKPLQWAIERMSKSKGNGVDPDEMVEIYGADATRIFTLFAAPVENELVWNETGIEGAVRFLQRVWRFVWKWQEKISDSTTCEIDKIEFSAEARKLRRKTHQTIKRVTENLESLQFNTPIAALMELLNAIYDFKVEPENASPGDLFAIREAVTSLIVMLAPFAPHVAEELYSQIVGNEKGLLANGVRFPEYDEELAKADEIEIPIQINGKLRSKVVASADASDEDLKALAFADAKIKEYINGKEIVKVIVVPKRLVNIVIKG